MFQPRFELSNWSPLDQLFGLRNELNRIFETNDTDGGRNEFFHSSVPLLDVFETKEDLVIQVEIPGLKKEDIQISLHNGALAIQGERKAPEHNDAEVYRTERFYGRFHRTFTLPKSVQADKVKALYQDGILTVRLPKTEEAKPRHINVNAA